MRRTVTSTWVFKSSDRPNGDRISTVGASIASNKAISISPYLSSSLKSDSWYLIRLCSFRYPWTSRDLVRILVRPLSIISLAFIGSLERGLRLLRLSAPSTFIHCRCGISLSGATRLVGGGKVVGSDG